MRISLHSITFANLRWYSPITRTLEASLLPAPKDSIGAKILKKMGWRLGQGIGPRISLKERKKQDVQAYEATTGTKFSGSTLDIADDDEEANKHMYAPRDTPILSVKRKDNMHGLGYTPGLSLNESLGGSSGGSGGPKLAGGFGLGALNDADEDDLDVYDHQPNSSRSRHAYDHINGDDDDTVVIGGKADKKASGAVGFHCTQISNIMLTVPRGCRRHRSLNISETGGRFLLDSF